MSNDKCQMTNEGRILKEEKAILEHEETLLEKLNFNVHKLATTLERARLDEYTTILSRPWKFFFFNFFVGVFRGVGLAVGMTLIGALVLFILVKVMRQMVDLPVIGYYIAEIVQFVNQYLKQGIPAR